MKKIISMIFLAAVIFMVAACGGRKEHKFIGSFTDEFGNKFELREDRTATITFVKSDPVETRWSDGVNHDSPYATIEYNGNPAYYYMRDGVLYRHLDNMMEGKLAIQITWDD